MAAYRSITVNNMFRRKLHPDLNSQWNDILTLLDKLNLSNEHDHIIWTLGAKKVFTTKSMYEHLESKLVGCDFRWIWKAKIPLKILIFLW